MQKEIDPEHIRKTLHDRGICVVVPTYNNEGTVGRVVGEILLYCRDVIVVNDGSSDSTGEILRSIGGITLVEYAGNKGKGHALKEGFRKAFGMGFYHVITIDADGQHYPKDIPALLEANEKYPGCLIVGERNLAGVERSFGSKFANRFSDFWFFVQTGYRLRDTQTGYRLYPIRKRLGLKILPSRYEAELMLMVMASWHGVGLKFVPVDVYYPPKEERVSHFRPYRDFARISVLNTILCLLAIVYGLPLRIIRATVRFLRTVYAALTFGFFSLFVVTPLARLYVAIGKMTEKKRWNMHMLIYRLSRFFMLTHGIPGAKFSYKVAGDVDFDKPQLIICNHQSHLDLPCQLIFTPKVVFLTNDWAWNCAFYSFIIRSAEYLSASGGVEVLLPQLRNLVSRGYSIAVFPEGTRSIDLSIGRFHQGAFYLAEQLDLDILPMVVYGTGMVLPKRGRRLHKAAMHIEVNSPFTREQLSKLGDNKAKASFFRAYYREKYREIKNEVDKHA